MYGTSCQSNIVASLMSLPGLGEKEEFQWEIRAYAGLRTLLLSPSSLTSVLQARLGDNNSVT